MHQKKNYQVTKTTHKKQNVNIEFTRQHIFTTLLVRERVFPLDTTQLLSISNNRQAAIHHSRIQLTSAEI